MSAVSCDDKSDHRLQPKPIGRLGRIGWGLVALGFGVNLTFAPVDDAPRVAGIIAAAVAGVGMSLLLLTAVFRLGTVFSAPPVTSSKPNDPARQSRTVTGEQWRPRAVLAFVFSRVATVIAAIACGSGIALYFTNFNFGSGGNDFGAAMIVAGLAVGLAAIIGDVVGLVTASLTWKHLGTKRWFIATVILLLLEIVAIAFLWSRM